MNKEEMTAYLVGQLREMGPVTTKKMFGGVGIFLEGTMFAKITGDGIPFLRVDDTNRGDFETLGQEQFYSGDKKKGMPYYQVPTIILEDQQRLLQWATKAYGVALANKK